PHMKIPRKTTFCTKWKQLQVKTPFVPIGSICMSRHILYQMEAAASKEFQEANSE
ncbi:hypothetical protein Tco_0815765, partial [Tanacetum coccineum]